MVVILISLYATQLKRSHGRSLGPAAVAPASVGAADCASTATAAAALEALAVEKDVVLAEAHRQRHAQRHCHHRQGGAHQRPANSQKYEAMEVVKRCRKCEGEGEGGGRGLGTWRLISHGQW